MSEAGAAKPKKSGKKKASPAAAAKEEAPQPMPPFKPGKVTHYDRQVVDYVRTATAKNIWYYRCAGGAGQGAWRPAMAPMRVQTAVHAGAHRLPPLAAAAASPCCICAASLRSPCRDHCCKSIVANRTCWLLPLSPCSDRLSTPRGPCSLPVLREAWTQGVIDANTLVWGQVRSPTRCCKCVTSGVVQEQRGRALAGAPPAFGWQLPAAPHSCQPM